jgi:hypothetical protein
MRIRTLSFVSLTLISLSAFAEPELQPYIDQLKSTLPEEKRVPDPTDSNPSPFIDSINAQAKDKKTDLDEESYTEHLKKTDPKLRENEDAKPFTEEAKKTLGPGEPTDGAIAAVTQGKSELHPRLDGEIHNAFGFSVGGGGTRNLSAPSDVQGANFNTLYGSGWAPDLRFFYEYQPFHSEWFGNFGIIASGAVAIHTGTGAFDQNVDVGASTNFGSSSQTQFRFLTLPATVGVIYRFNLLRVIRPFVSVSAAAVGFIESRSDREATMSGYSLGYQAVGGVNILLNGVSKGALWELYSSADVKKYYLTVDFTRLQTIIRPVRFEISAVNIGFTFEY